MDIDYVNVVNQLDTSFTYALDNPDRPGVQWLTLAPGKRRWHRYAGLTTPFRVKVSWSCNPGPEGQLVSGLLAPRFLTLDDERIALEEELRSRQHLSWPPGTENSQVCRAESRGGCVDSSGASG